MTKRERKYTEISTLTLLSVIQANFHPSFLKVTKFAHLFKVLYKKARSMNFLTKKKKEKKKKKASKFPIIVYA